MVAWIARPFFGEELLALALQQQLARACVDEHAQAPPLLDQLLVDELLVALQHGERIDPDTRRRRCAPRAADRLA